MERYENLGLVGEGSYGMVMKCRHKETSQLVAIKKFIESEDDKMVKKIAMREIRMLKSLHHENLVNLLEVFRRKKRLFLVFEFVDRTVLDDLERHPNGLDEISTKKVSFQVLRGLEFCHNHNIIHRDVKPENILVSKSGVVKLCDFGFARTLAIGPGEVFTDYVATRWYRAPELLVGDTNYGKAVDIWAVGCLLAEMLTGEPLFPGDSDIDQLFHITKCLGNLSQRHREIFHRNPLFLGMRLPEVKDFDPLERRYPKITPTALDLIKQSLQMEGSDRPTCSNMLRHEFYKSNSFLEKFLPELKNKIEKERAENPLLRTLAVRRESAEEKAKKEKEKERENEKERKEKRLKKEHTQKSIEAKEAKDKKKRELAGKKPSNTSIQQQTKSSSPDAKVPHLSNSNDNIMNKTNQQLGNIQLSPIQDVEPQTRMDETRTENLPPSRSDTKLSSRTTLGLNITTPGSDLPDLPSSQGYRGLEPKLKKANLSFSKKTTSAMDLNGSYSSIDRSGHYDQRTGSIQERHDKKSISEESNYVEKTSKKKGTKHNSDHLLKETRREGSDVGLPPVTGLTLPSVKGAEGKTTGKQGAKSTKKSYFSTMPHITNLDLFQSNITTRESPVEGRQTNHRDRDSKDSGNLPEL